MQFCTLYSPVRKQHITMVSKQCLQGTPISILYYMHVAVDIHEASVKEGGYSVLTLAK